MFQAIKAAVVCKLKYLRQCSREYLFYGDDQTDQVERLTVFAIAQVPRFTAIAQIAKSQ